MNARTIPLALIAGLALAGPGRATDPVIPPTFSAPLESTNTYVPFHDGAYKLYTGKDHGSKIAVIDRFTADETRTFEAYGQMVECWLLEEIEFEDGELVEISRNWFAEADDGTVFYFGETVDNYEDGELADHDGSWLVGGPLEGDPEETATAEVPAVFMPANPEKGETWKPEDLFPLVDETVEAKKLGGKVRVPAGKFKDVLKVEESSDLPDTTKERKTYAPGVGFVKAKGRREKLVMIASTLGVDLGAGDDED